MPFARAGRPGLLGTVARAVAISGTPPRGGTSPATTPPAGRNQLADQLTRLAELHSSGLLTDAEFAAAKARLLM